MIKLKGKIAFVGGDLRQLTAAEQIGRVGAEAAVFALPDAGDFVHITRAADLTGALCGADAVITGIPVSNDGIHIYAPSCNQPLTVDELLRKMDTSSLFLGGMIDDTIKNKASVLGIRCADYADNEKMKVLNAIPTAEGALSIAMSELPVTIHSCRSLVLGYGRIARVLSHKLNLLGSDVTVAARRQSELAWAESYGASTLPIFDIAASLPSFDVIFNTVPHMILGPEELSRVQDSTPVIDLASKPGGVDFVAARQLGKKVIWALSLPGKVAPVTSGKIIAETVASLIADGGTA